VKGGLASQGSAEPIAELTGHAGRALSANHPPDLRHIGASDLEVLNDQVRSSEAHPPIDFQ
jgi:hypothetical protein